MAEYHASIKRVQDARHEHDANLTCCEEQDMLEQKFFSRIAAATNATEERLLFGHRLRERMNRSLRCTDPCCDHAECGECESDGADAATVPALAVSASGDESDDFDDDDDGEFMAKMRAARIGQMHSGAEAALRKRAGLGTHVRLLDGQGEKLESLLDAPTPLILHLALEDSERSRWVEDTLARKAALFPSARLATETCSAGRPPECLAFVRALPALLTIEAGVVTGTAYELPILREPESVVGCVEGWLEAERARLGAVTARAAVKGSDDEEGGETQPSYCGRPGCRTYAHEHVTPGERGGRYVGGQRWIQQGD